MTRSFTHILRYTLLLMAGFVFGLLTIAAIFGTDTKQLFSRMLSFTHKGTVADASCAIPTEKTHEVYFVSCGGFF